MPDNSVEITQAHLHLIPAENVPNLRAMAEKVAAREYDGLHNFAQGAVCAVFKVVSRSAVVVSFADEAAIGPMSTLRTWPLINQYDTSEDERGGNIIQKDDSFPKEQRA